jgi:hypothetical protein
VAAKLAASRVVLSSTKLVMYFVAMCKLTLFLISVTKQANLTVKLYNFNRNYSLRISDETQAILIVSFL